MTVQIKQAERGAITISDGENLVRLPGHYLAMYPQLRQVLTEIAMPPLREYQCCDYGRLTDTIQGDRYFCVKHGWSDPLPPMKGGDR